MTHVGFIGLGHMGSPMALNLLKAGYPLSVFDIAADMQPQKSAGARIANSIADAISESDIIITMLPESKHVMAVYEGETGVFALAKSNALLIDCSTIDILSCRRLHEIAQTKQLALLDAPVSGGTKGAALGTLTFMVGGETEHFERAKPIFAHMGKNIFYAGSGGNGQAAKICNNMLLGISMIGTSEAFHLADKLGLDAKIFHDIVAASSGQCWSATNYSPVPGLVPNTPANNHYEPGFTAKMMLKDLNLAQQAAITSGASTLLGSEAMSIYRLLCNCGLSEKDFSSIYPWLNNKEF
ncbi:MAG: 3-hydroxyisobutyrate dehydrogenase [Legionellales bacterium]|nr:3-hydroxyisobutyrate dehydrogenase [Legionellales bacterium]